MKVGIIRGDGIGPEIMDATLSVLALVSKDLEFVTLHAGEDGIRESGNPLSASMLEELTSLGTALKGPLLSPARSGAVTINRRGREIVHMSLGNAFRDALGLFANVRPIRRWNGLADEKAWSELVIVRMVSEGSYSGIGHWLGDFAGVDMRIISRAACERFLRFAFSYAEGAGRNVILGHKSALLPHTDGFMVEIAKELAPEFPGTTVTFKLVDALAAELVSSPEALDMLVLEYQYGDILSDVAAASAGSIGTGAGANFGTDVAMFEASHGAAPDIAGKGIANPLGLILSGALMLRHLGQREAADRIDRGIGRVMVAGAENVTPDLGGLATTAQMAKTICAAIEWDD